MEIGKDQDIFIKTILEDKDPLDILSTVGLL